MWGRTRRDARRTRGGSSGGCLSAGSSWSGTSNCARFPGAAATPGGQSAVCVLGLPPRLGAEALRTRGLQGRVYPLSILWSPSSEPRIFPLSLANRVLAAFAPAVSNSLSIH
ncbi:hypothetical protein NN561_007956 [Cricetulus griseus]